MVCHFSSDRHIFATNHVEQKMLYETIFLIFQNTLRKFLQSRVSYTGIFCTSGRDVYALLLTRKGASVLATVKLFCILYERGCLMLQNDLKINTTIALLICQSEERMNWFSSSFPEKLIKYFWVCEYTL